MLFFSSVLVLASPITPNRGETLFTSSVGKSRKWMYVPPVFKCCLGAGFVRFMRCNLILSYPEKLIRSFLWRKCCLKLFDLAAQICNISFETLRLRRAEWIAELTIIS
jgi:hypothetical protein